MIKVPSNFVMNEDGITVEPFSLTFGVDLTDREVRMIAHALEYEAEFPDAGIPGHGQIVLIAKLARAIGFERD